MAHVPMLEPLFGANLTGSDWNYGRGRCANRLGNSPSQGTRWKALINKYIGVIPVSGDRSGVVAQIISSVLLRCTALSSAMMAKVGVAASDNKRATLALVRFRPRAVSVATASIMAAIISNASPLFARY